MAGHRVPEVLLGLDRPEGVVNSDGAAAPDVSVVMPCLNEEVTLPGCIERAHALLEELKQRHGLSGEIVVADNGSTDRSRDIALEGGARIASVTEKGYGNALRGGFTDARGRILVMGDADGSYDFREAMPLVEKVAKGDDLSLGTRIKGTIAPGAMPWKNRWIGNPALTGILNVLFRAGVSDAHCGMRALSKSAFQRLHLTSAGMEFASEMVVKAALLKMKISETPITLHKDGRDRPPHLRPWRDGWRHLRYLLMLSPTWLFFAPALALAVVGLTIFAGLLFHPEQEMVNVLGFRFGDHWMIIAGGMLAVAHQAALFGVASLIYSIRERYREPRPVHAAILRAARLEFMLIASFVLIGLGAAVFLRVIHIWAQSGFGPLSAVRELVGATTLFVLGAQNFLGGFLLAIVAGNEAKPERSILEPAGRGRE
jgi:glycosyltransferase involved in cell wall biosynthesis